MQACIAEDNMWVLADLPESNNTLPRDPFHRITLLQTAVEAAAADDLRSYVRNRRRSCPDDRSVLHI